ncbi:MAG TPA: pitrilysin family protein [Caldimonas sp.]|nr:pitrilysin family protein [Caldimonas sp.]
MRRHYTGEQLVLAGAGKVDHDQLVALAQTAFTELPTAGLPPAAEALYVGGDFRDARDLEQVHLVLGLPGIGYKDPDYYASSVYSTLLGGGMSSRLFQEIREKRGLVYSIYSFASAYVDGGVFGVYAGTGEAEVAELVPLVCAELAKSGDGIDVEEVRRARAQLRAGILMARESPSSRCEQLAQQLLVYGRPLAMEEVIARVEAVDVAQVAGVAQRVLAGPLTLTALGPIDRLEPYAAIAARLR